MADWPERVVTTSPEATREFARRLAALLPDGAVLALHGELGAGKTCLVQGLAEALGVAGVVNSPTYTIINEYRGRRRLYHIDLYRIGRAREALDLGLDEYLPADGITAIEWAERVESLLPAGTVHVRLEPGATEQERVITVRREGSAP
jgi:tRNA threonylcarbamoyladenosine biosynthesis protein TsaE